VRLGLDLGAVSRPPPTTVTLEETRCPLLEQRAHCDLRRATVISGLLMATVRVVATLRGQPRGVLSAIVIGSDLLLGIGGLELARQFDRNNPAAGPPGFNPALAQRCPPMHRSRDLKEVLP
jgi:hypothetical protein